MKNEIIISKDTLEYMKNSLNEIVIDYNWCETVVEQANSGSYAHDIAQQLMTEIDEILTQNKKE